MKKTLFVLLALLMGLLGCAGIPLSKDECNATLFPTAHEHELCLKAASDYEIEQDELADKRLVKRDKLIMFLNGCDADNQLILAEIKRGSSRSCLPSDRAKRKAMREYGYKYTHGNVCPRAQKIDFQCWDRHDFDEAMRSIGY
jgi:hypothetical protein